MSMDLSELSICEGSMYLDEILAMPRRSQELYFALLNNDICKQNKQGMEILDNILSINCDLLYKKCQSPIEKIFIFAYDIVVANEDFLINEVFYLTSQKRISANGHKYCADFYFDTDELPNVVYEHELKLVVECDGHDFHEKTKEQVEKTNQRNFDLQKEGYEILHFSGSQIYQNPIKCASAVFEYIKSKVGGFELKL